MVKKINKIQKNSEVEFIGLVSKKIIGISGNGKKYLSLEITDNSGKIDAKLWDADNFIDLISVGGVYKFNGFANLFKNNLQFKIIKFSQLEEQEIKWSHFIQEAPINEKEEFEFITNIIKKVNNNDYKKILLEIVNKYEKQFMIWPAASKFHHSIRKGLLWHTSSMLKTASSLPKIYSIYNTINFDLLYCGIILHDLGKVIELNIENGIYKYSLRGNLVGHISIINAELNCTLEKLNIKYNDDIALLEHMILASHGKLEFGSPVLPNLLEAEILYLLDNLDARIFSISNELKSTEKNNFTNRIAPLENRHFYNHFYDLKKQKK